ncbi:hypothetical protein [Bacteroides sp. 224]|uniref:hypothetical protein n=1 Tax=Bacteroides sp. 224 TaxID=2302936 RepID=UPI0013D035A3|nr:hypothetical protein [Bacteroides sp. 224]NDV65864.1 hypothetical protein [Bacteroides sp. 224]
MKITNKIIILLMAALLPMGFAGCSDDDEIPNPGTEETPEFILEQELLKVKIGSENKATVAIKEGGGEYNAFCLDESLAKVEMVNGVITIEGFANGQTSLIISDKYSRYRKLPISVYTTDVLELSTKNTELTTKLGSSKSITANVVLGNDGYKIESNNPAVEASITEEGEIKITATSKKADYVATITVTDCTGLSENILVSVKATFEPFTNEELETIMETNARRYFYNNSNTFNTYYTPLNEIVDGKQRYGWKYYTYYWIYIDFTGDKSVGTKSDALFTYHTWSNDTIENITLKIIKNDGTNIWGIFSYINDSEEKLYTGYFCDTVN